MTFLNRKEEVMDIELTQYGKYLLSKGQLKPVFYAFYDDDIIYDTQYAGHAEIQNDSETRIKETPRTMTQYLFGGAETEIFSANQEHRNELVPSLQPDLDDVKKVQSTPDKLRSPQLPLGTSEQNSQYIPAWSVHFLNGELLTSTSVLSSSAETPKGQEVPIQPIPQLTTEIDYKKWIYTEAFPQDSLDKYSSTDFISDKFPDGSVLVVEKDHLLISIEEENGIFENENFDIEFFEVFEEKDDDGKVISTVEQSLLFLKDIEADPKENHVDYYFDVSLDSEIDPQILCEGIEKIKVKNIYIDEGVDCDSVIQKVSKNVYINTNESEEFCD